MLSEMIHMLPFSITRLEAKYKTTNYNSVDLHKTAFFYCQRLLLYHLYYVIFYLYMQVQSYHPDFV